MQITRRQFLELATGGALWYLTGLSNASAEPYRVGVKHSADPYTATLQAIAASSEWPAKAISGRKVVIKPNLVIPRTADTGITTDPQVVRALVDLSLEAQAARVLIVESGPQGANFAACGYEFLNDYDPAGRVALVDLNDEPVTLAPVPGGGLAYQRIYMPQVVLANDVVFISAAKLKCHFHTLATLTMKNLMGLTPADRYRVPPEQWRFAIHRRGINQAIVDLNLVRPIDFAVVDGVWGMEGKGPVAGTKVKMDLILAGRNALAVDRVGLTAMGISQGQVQHLAYAASRGIGPSDATSIEVVGDTLRPYAFAQPNIPPIVDAPQCTPLSFNPRAGEHTDISYQVDRACRTRVEIVHTLETTPKEEIIRVLHDWLQHPAGSETLTWDGRDEAGDIVPAGTYTARIHADTGPGTTEASATGWVNVVHSGPFEMRLPVVTR